MVCVWLVVYVYECVCVGLPHQHHHHQLVQTLDFPPFVFALPFAGANFLDCLGIGIGISLVLFFSSSPLLSLYVMRCHLSLFSFFDPPLSHTSVAPHDSDFWHFTRAYFLPSFFIISLDCFFLSFSRPGGKGQHSFCIDKPSTYLPGEMGFPSCSPVADLRLTKLIRMQQKNSELSFRPYLTPNETEIPLKIIMNELCSLLSCCCWGC